MIFDTKKADDKYLYIAKFPKSSILKYRILPEEVRRFIKDIENYFKITLEDRGQKENTHLFSNPSASLKVLVFEPIQKRELDGLGVLKMQGDIALEVKLVYPLDYGNLPKSILDKYQLKQLNGFDIRNYLPKLF